MAWPKTGRSNWSRTQVEAYASTAPVHHFLYPVDDGFPHVDINNPPEPIEDAPIDEEIIVPEAPVEEDCGCATTPSPGWVGLLGLLALARRR